jgi:hypothetical protein
MPMTANTSGRGGPVYPQTLGQLVFWLTIQPDAHFLRDAQVLAVDAFPRPRRAPRVERETLVRDLPVGVPVCRKGEAVEHWIGLSTGW